MKGKTKEYLFVDGYNIINAWPELRELSNISLETARNELINLMSEYQAYTGIKVIIVFDAHLVKGSNEKKELNSGVEVVYTKERETADHYIEKTLDSIGRIKNVKVATSDWVEQQIVFARGGTRISARELREELNVIRKNIKKKIEKEKEKPQGLLKDRLDAKILEKLEKICRNE